MNFGTAVSGLLREIHHTTQTAGEHKMTERFYVIYHPRTDQYADVDGGLGSFAEAARMDRDDAIMTLGELDGSLFRIVGPCIEGETP